MKRRALLSLLVSSLVCAPLLGGCSPQGEASSGSSAPPPSAQAGEGFVLTQPSPRTRTLRDPQTSLKGVTNLKAVGMLTGEQSVNKTKTNYNIAGCDLGIFIQHKDKVYIAFGDTFSGDDSGNHMVGGWRSNTLAYTSDLDASDGIRFDGMISNAKVGDKKAIEILPSQKADRIEMTVIPTGGFSLGGAMYLAFMSVRHWGEPGSWEVNYGGLAKSADDGQTWQKLDSLKWEDPSFGQLCPLVVGDTVYFYAIPGGRNGGLKIMRVQADRVEQRDQYEYLTGFGADGAPVFGKGDPAKTAEVVPPAVGEPCVVFNRYLDEYLLVYFSGNQIGLRASKNPWGPWSAFLPFVSSEDYPQLYGGFMSPAYTSNGGKTVYFTMSLYGDYNVALMSLDLMK